MKTVVFTIVGVVVYLSILYFVDQNNKKNDHPTLNKEAKLPDELLIDAVIAYQRNDRDECILKIEASIGSIWNLEKDVELKDPVLLEDAVVHLEKLHKGIIEASFTDYEIKETYKKVLTLLAISELSVAKEQLLKDNEIYYMVAMNYSILHLKNSQLFHTASVASELNLDLYIEEIERLIELHTDGGAYSKNELTELDELIFNLKKLSK